MNFGLQCDKKKFIISFQSMSITSSSFKAVVISRSLPFLKRVLEKCSQHSPQDVARPSPLPGTWLLFQVDPTAPSHSSDPVRIPLEVQLLLLLLSHPEAFFGELTPYCLTLKLVWRTTLTVTLEAFGFTAFTLQAFWTTLSPFKLGPLLCLQLGYNPYPRPWSVTFS